MVGSWDVNVSIGSAPEKVATALGKLNETLVGAQYTPIAYLGSQVVNGLNHAVLAEQLVVTGKDVKNIVLLIFNEKPNDMEVTLVNIERVLESGGELGGTKINVETRGNINDDAQKLFDENFTCYCGAKVEPIALLGTQVVKGVNYIFACEFTPVVLEPEKKVVLVTLNSEGLATQFTDLLNSNVRLKATDEVKASLKMSAPWTIFYKEVYELFKRDPQVNVLYNYEEPELKLWVKGNDEKAAALARFMPTTKTFGNVVLNISVVGDDGQPVPDINCPDIEAFKKMFDGNGAVSFVKSIQTPFGDTFTYAVFVKEVVQFFSDNMFDLYGATSTLYQTIAADIFEDTLAEKGGFFFTTEANAALGYAFTWLKKENSYLGAPLGEWP